MEITLKVYGKKDGYNYEFEVKAEGLKYGVDLEHALKKTRHVFEEIKETIYPRKES